LLGLLGSEFFFEGRSDCVCFLHAEASASSSHFYYYRDSGDFGLCQNNIIVKMSISTEKICSLKSDRRQNELIEDFLDKAKTCTIVTSSSDASLKSTSEGPKFIDLNQLTSLNINDLNYFETRTSCYLLMEVSSVVIFDEEFYMAIVQDR
jgi:hypothetical protein